MSLCIHNDESLEKVRKHMEYCIKMNYSELAGSFAMEIAVYIFEQFPHLREE